LSGQPGAGLSSRAGPCAAAYCEVLPPVDEPVPDLSLLLAPGALGPLPPLSLRQRCSSVPISPTHSVGVAAVEPLAALSLAEVLPPDDALPGVLMPDALLPDGLLPGVSPGAVPPVELPTAPELAPVAPPPELPLLSPLLAPALLPEAPPALPPAAPPAPPAPPWAHDAVAKPTKAAVTAALITFTIMVNTSRFGWKGLPWDSTQEQCPLFA
jgi:hypothetical protein